MNNRESRWAGYWWLRADEIGTWSTEELKAAGTIWLTFVCMATFNGLAGFIYLYAMDFGVRGCFLGAFLFAMISCFYFRDAAGEVFKT